MAPKDTAPKTYNFEVAKTVLSANDKDRLVCLYLNCDPKAVSHQLEFLQSALHADNRTPQIDWAKATTQFGAASVESMRVMTRSALKKIETAEAKGGVPAGTAAATPKKAAGGRKRKADADADAEDDDDEAAPKPKKGRPAKKGKKADTPVEGELSLC